MNIISLGIGYKLYIDLKDAMIMAKEANQRVTADFFYLNLNQHKEFIVV